MHVVTYFDFIPEKGDAGKILLGRHATTTTLQAGCERCELLQEQAIPNHFMLVEAWNDSRLRDAYLGSEACGQFRTSLQPMIAAPPDERRAALVRPLN